jgi:hypothetical protein
MVLPDIESFQLLVVTIKWNDLKEAIVKSQSNYATQWIYNSYAASFRLTTDSILYTISIIF